MTKVNFHQKALVFNGERKFLAIKRSYGNETWDIVGGAVEIPENHEKALRREIKEEAGLEVTDLEPLKVESAYNEDEEAYVLFIGYRCNAVTEDIKLSKEHTSYKWVSKEEFLNLDSTPYLKDFVKSVL